VGRWGVSHNPWQQGPCRPVLPPPPPPPVLLNIVYTLRPLPCVVPPMQPVCFGVAIQLRHVKSGKLLCATADPPETDQNATAVQVAEALRCVR
jgi:hypothetical protein